MTAYSFRTSTVSLCALLTLSAALFAQSPSDWDDIHFESGSSVVAEGFSSLLRLARMLSEHRDYRLALAGHADSLEGNNAITERLALARADAVKACLVKYGAPADQITTSGDGKRLPAASSYTKEGRFQNRRVTLSLRDLQGHAIDQGDVPSDIMLRLLKHQEDDVRATLKRLDMLDNILAAQRDVKGENDRLKSELADVRNELSMQRQALDSAPKPLTQQQTVESVAQALGRVSASNGPVWPGGVSGREFLIGRAVESRGYGLYSYLLIPRKPLDLETDLKAKYVAVLDAYLAMIDTISAIHNQPKPPARKNINITYLPLQFLPAGIDTGSLLLANNSALAQTLLQLLKTKHAGVEKEDGPFLVSYTKPLTSTTRLNDHLFIDMSHVPANAAALYVRAFRTQAARERYWEKNRDQWILDCYAFIENAGGEFEDIATQYKDKGLLSTIFGWFK